MSAHHYIIGCGGVGSWLTPALAMLVGPKHLTVIDGDTIEDRNLNRQLFTARDIGRNKAEALQSLYGCAALPSWYARGVVAHVASDWLLVCVDNHTARREALAACDRYRCKAICAANERISAEAYLYLPAWKDGPLDPRVYYPELLTDTADDPRAAEIGCTGAAQTADPQLSSANFIAAGLLQHLLVAWTLEARNLDTEARRCLPHRLTMNLTRSECYRVSDTLAAATVAA